MNTEKNQWKHAISEKQNITKKIKIKEKASSVTQGLLMGKWMEVFSNKATYYD